MAVCTHCKKPFSLTSHSLVTRVSAYTILEFDCVECLIQYCNDNTNAYWNEAVKLLKMYLDNKKIEKEIPYQFQDNVATQLAMNLLGNEEMEIPF